VAREGHEVGVKGHHVHRQVRHGLGGIDDHPRPAAMGPVDQIPQGRDRAQHVRHGGDGHQPHSSRELPLERIEIEPAILGHLGELQHQAGLSGQYLPGDEVRVVLQHAEEDLVARPEECAAPGLGHQVDRLCRAPGEHHLIRIGGPEETRHPGPG
jgi:hypothetical protein